MKEFLLARRENRGELAQHGESFPVGNACFRKKLAPSLKFNRSATALSASVSQYFNPCESHQVAIEKRMTFGIESDEKPTTVPDQRVPDSRGNLVDKIVVVPLGTKKKTDPHHQTWVALPVELFPSLLFVGETPLDKMLVRPYFATGRPASSALSNRDLRRRGDVTIHNLFLF